MSVGLFILLLIAIWIVPKLIRGYMFVHRVRKQTRQMYEQMYNGGFASGDMPGGGTGRSRKRDHKGARQDPRRKKIDPAVGEYVNFEEISDTRASVSDTGTDNATYMVEQQVSDAEWEDI